MVISKEINIITNDYKLDLEHSQIFSSIDELQTNFISQTVRIAICEKLLHYIGTHCKDEEYFMFLNKYPELEAHKEAHRQLQDSFLKYLNQFICDDNITTNEEIRSIFYNHIIDTDIPMIKYILKDSKNI